jgi:hypothetical protein
VAPENLSAIRGLADIHRKRGEIPEALAQFKSAFDMASPDPTIDQIVRDLRRDAVAPSVPGDSSGSLSPAGTAATSFTAGRPALQPESVAEDPRAARRAVAYQERWLEAILADRRSRLYGAHA